MTKTPQDIEALKSDWYNDPCFDIEDARGFEAHREELSAFRHRCEVEWATKKTARLAERAQALGCPNNIQLASYVENLETRLLSLSARLDDLERA